MKISILQEAYEEVLLNEIIADKKIAKMIVDWKKKWLNSASDKNRVKKLLGQVIQLLGSTIDNIEMMDQISSLFVAIGKYVSEEASDELAKILEEI